MTLKLGVIGLGMGGSHSWGAMRAKGVHLTAVADPNPEAIARYMKNTRKRRPEFSKTVDQLTFFKDYRDMADSGTVDAVLAALPTDMHCSASIDLLKRGVHVLCEKPPTVNAREMKRVWHTAKSTGLTYAFVRQQRFCPKIFASRAVVTKGRLGNIFHAESKWLRTRMIPWRGGWGVNKDAGGGVLLDLGVHQLDDAWFVMGNPEPVSAYGNMHCAYAHLAKGRKLNMAYNADDATFGTIKFANGASLDLAVTFALTSAGPDDDAIEGEGNRDWRELKIYGSQAGLDVYRNRFITCQKENVKVSELPTTKKIENMSRDSVGLIEDFARAIRTGTPPLNNVDQALQLMQMLDALKKSADTGRVIPIKPVS